MQHPFEQIVDDLLTTFPIPLYFTQKCLRTIFNTYTQTRTIIGSIFNRNSTSRAAIYALHVPSITNKHQLHAIGK